MINVEGVYYGVPFTGVIREKSYNSIYVDLDKNIVDFKTGKSICKSPRSSLFLEGWVDGKEFHWGYCRVVS